MATVTTTAPPSAPPPQALKLESLPRIVTTTLSQSELQALSLCSLSAFDLTSTTNLVFPHVDRSLFNESAGSRRQTYSRPRKPLSPSDSPTGHRRRVAGLLPTPKLPPVPDDDPENLENRKIIDYLKQLIREDPKFDQVELAPPSVSHEVVPNFELRDGMEESEDMGLVRKRKRGRKPKVKAHLKECYREMDFVNKGGVAFDLSALANTEDPFSDELRRRTEGLQSEEELLGFLRDLGGQWGSRRKKRKIVDAGDFGDVLPVGWKLLLGLKRKDGRAWIYCRRYISPSGEQFVSCKEVSSYLQSLFSHNDAQLPITRGVENMLTDNRGTTQSFAGVTPEEQDRRMIIANDSAPPSSSECNDRSKDVALLGIENLADVQIQDLFECHKCSMTFYEKDSYLQHLLSFHQRTTRRYRLGSSVGDGVIIKDGKFECQFCHKVFLERRRYNGHVGIHVRNYVKKVEESPSQVNVQRKDKSLIREDLPSRISKMDALIEIAQNSIMENSAIEPLGNRTTSPDKLNVISTTEIAVGNLDHDNIIESPLSDLQMEDSISYKNVNHDLNHQGSQLAVMDEEVEKTDGGKKTMDSKIETCEDPICLSTVNDQNADAFENSEIKDDVVMAFDGLDQSSVDMEGVSRSPLLTLSGNDMTPEVENNQSSGGTVTVEQLNHEGDSRIRNEFKVELDGTKDVSVMPKFQETSLPTSEENTVSSEVPTPSMSMVQSLDYFSHLTGLSDKGEKENQYCSVDHRHDDVSGSQELRIDETETTKCDFSIGQPSLPLSQVPTVLANKTLMEEEEEEEEEGACASSVQVQSQEAGRHQITTSCVWCGVEFDYDAVDSEIQPDSVGFMCPVCKAKISGQIDVLDSGSPLNSGHI
ncbi:hypothetical protein QN277_019980 [Acacia crassicarpa]|uniref:Uncharacterized protein n=1 Tax=Acacia crassicarpa TaxID=499986 RepID=A0AAE1KCG5_9FABA|nr:hypothetical protein QN277_019980 [Acacia crassicarpa]